MKQFLRVTVVRTTRTDLMCVRCGRFRTQFAIVGARETSDANAMVGVHRGPCELAMHATRRMPARQAPTQAAAEATS